MKMRKMTLVIALSLVMLLTVSCTNGGASIDDGDISATADIMRLEKFEGEVTIVNGDGEEIEPFEGMKLYSGYEIQTADKSQAYISLDESKAIKLDMNSASSIKNDGKNLIITLTTGKLFFSASEPLADDETMQIETSNMITGIRGTSGIITAMNEGGITKSTSSVITGKVVVNAFTASGEEIDTIEIVAGQEAQYTDGSEKIEHSDIEYKDIPDFAKEAINSDDELKEEIEENDDFDLDELIETDDDDDDDETDNSSNTSNDRGDDSESKGGGNVTPTPTPPTGDNDDDSDNTSDGGDDDSESEAGGNVTPPPAPTTPAPTTPTPPPAPPTGDNEGNEGGDGDEDDGDEDGDEGEDD